MKKAIIYFSFYLVAIAAIITTAAVSVYATDYVLHIGNGFQTVTCKVFVKYIEYFASIRWDLFDFRVAVYCTIMAMAATLGGCVTAVIFDKLEEKVF